MLPHPFVFPRPFVSSLVETPGRRVRTHGVSTWPAAKFILSGCKPAEGLDTNGLRVMLDTNRLMVARDFNRLRLLDTNGLKGVASPQ